MLGFCFYHTQYHNLYVIIDKPFLSCKDMIEKIEYHIWYHSFWYDIISNIIFRIVKSLSCDIYIGYCLWYRMYIIQKLHLYKWVLISMIFFNASDVNNLWYLCHVISHILMISLLISWHLRDGMARVAEGRHAPGTLPPLRLASPSPTCWGLQSKSYNPSWPLSSCQLRQSSSGLGHSGLSRQLISSESGPPRPGWVTGSSLRMTQGPSSWDPIMAVVYQRYACVSSCTSANIERQLHTAPLQK
jgi:hypothetical protein